MWPGVMGSTTKRLSWEARPRKSRHSVKASGSISPGLCAADGGGLYGSRQRHLCAAFVRRRRFAAQVLAKYPPGTNPQATYERSFTDPGKCRGLHVLELQAASNADNAVWGYDFTYQNAPYYFPKMPNPENPSGNFPAKASHTIDIQFLFPSWHGGNLGVNLDQFNGQPRELQGLRLPCLTSWWRRRTSRPPAIRTDRELRSGQSSRGLAGVPQAGRSQRDRNRSAI